MHRYVILLRIREGIWEMSINWLIEKFNMYAKKEAIIYNNSAYTYAQLIELYNEWNKTLENLTIREGEVVIVLGDYSPKTITFILSLIKNRNIIVPLASISDEQVEEYAQIVEADKMYRIYENDTVVTDLSSGLKIETKCKNALIQELQVKKEPGLILLTSGSTGKPKAVMHSFSKILEKYKQNRHALRTLTFLLFDHIGGINTLFHILSNGGTVITVKNRNSESVLKAVQEYKVELLPTSPTFLNMLLLHEQYKKYDLSSLKIISYGTEAMGEGVLKKLNDIFPNVQFKQTYGLSELGIMSSKSMSSDSLWVKIGGEGFETKVVEGILYIRSESAMLGYLNAPCPFDEAGWFNTQDQVEMNGDYFKILGRKSDIINVGGQKVYPQEVEEIILQIPGVEDVAVKGETNIIMGNIVTAKVNLTTNESLDSFKERMSEFLKDKIEPYKIPIKVEIVDTELFNSRFKRIRK
jgi:long-chain acyl-CoA synthetase